MTKQNMEEEEGEKWLDRNCWRNKGRLYRYFAMINISFLGLGAFVCFDAAGALQEALMKTFDINFSQFSLIYSINSWPNIVLSFFGGVLIDRVFGLKKGTLLYSVIFACGHMVFSLGVLLSTYWLGLFGRFVTGIGSEFLYICLQMYAVIYFKGKELSMVMCINISVARLGSSIVYAIADPILIDIRKILPGPESVGVTVFIVGVFTSLTLLGASMLACMNPKGYESKMEEEKLKPKTKLTWRDFVMFPLEFWLIILVQVSFTVTIYVFLPFTQDFFGTMYGMTVDQANSVTSYFSIIGAVIAPFIGVMIDKLGRALVFSKLGLIFALLAHVILGYSSWSPYFSLFVLSLAYGLFNGSIVPMFAYIIPDNKLGTAYGVGLALINGAYALTIYLAGVIVDAYSYEGLEAFMFFFVAVGFVASIGLWMKDSRGSGILNMTPGERSIYLEKNAADAADPVKEPLQSKNGV